MLLSQHTQLHHRGCMRSEVTAFDEVFPIHADAFQHRRDFFFIQFQKRQQTFQKRKFQLLGRQPLHSERIIFKELLLTGEIHLCIPHSRHLKYGLIVNYKCNSLDNNIALCYLKIRKLSKLFYHSLASHRQLVNEKLLCTLKISHPSPKTILAGEVCRDAAKAASVPRRSQRRVRQQKAAGQERVWRMVTGKEKSRPAAATVGRRAAFRKTRTATVFNLTEGPPKRKFFLRKF